MLLGYVVCKNDIMTKFLILYIYEHKTSRSRIPRQIIFLYYINVVNKCVVTNCANDYATGKKKSSFLFPEDEALRKKFISLIARLGTDKIFCSMYRPLL